MSIVIGIPTTTKIGTNVPRTSGTLGAISDSENLKRPAVGLVLHAASAITLVTPEGDTITYGSGEMALGVQHGIKIRQVRATGTTATNAQFSLLFSKY